MARESRRGREGDRKKVWGADVLSRFAKLISSMRCDARKKQRGRGRAGREFAERRVESESPESPRRRTVGSRLLPGPRCIFARVRVRARERDRRRGGEMLALHGVTIVERRKERENDRRRFVVKSSNFVHKSRLPSPSPKNAD